MADDWNYRDHGTPVHAISLDEQAELGRRQQQLRLSDLPNVGPKMIVYLNLLDISRPGELKGRDPYVLYRRLCELRGPTDYCVLDTFIALVRFMDDGVKRSWWHFTAERKRTMADQS